MPYDGHNPIDLSAFPSAPPAPPAPPPPARSPLRLRRPAAAKPPRAAPSPPRKPSPRPAPPEVPPPQDAAPDAARTGLIASVFYVAWMVVRFIVLGCAWLFWRLLRVGMRGYWSGRDL